MTKTSSDSSGHPDHWLRRDRYLLYVIALVFLVLGLLLIMVSISIEGLSDEWSKALSEAGIAAIIAGLLLAGSEWYVKESLFSQIEAKFAETLDSFVTTAFDLQQFARLPHELRERLRSRVLSAPVIQTDVTYVYELESIESECDKVFKASVNACSTYVNLTTVSQYFMVKEALPVLSGEHRPDYGFRRITSVLTGDGEFPTEIIRQVTLPPTYPHS